ncbi:MAG TPA: hypothetical protein VGC97_22780 [Pyrinomonadaceae bacterium]
MVKVFIFVFIFLLMMFYALPLVEAQTGDFTYFVQNAAPKSNNKMIYHNGAVMLGTSNVYFIWYGCWTCGYAGSNSNTRTILTDLSVNLGSSPYFRINTTYPDANGSAPSGGLIYGGSVTDASYSEGNDLSAAAIETLVAKQLAAGSLPIDPFAVYIVFGSSDISSAATGFCTPSAFAPHHGYFGFGGSQIKYAFVGNAARCPEIAAPQFYGSRGRLLPTPNANLAADAMASAMAHALDATITDPALTAWFDRSGLENAGICAGKFGSVYTTANGAKANMRLGARDFLIQQNWVNTARGYCSLAYP